ncbi:hypothetical protein, partial [Candidatus Accumulibacter vicinus]|uniref:hypothetical protein n=1 Tax=Candidatus Accumulibacter vicinus TaxID=2954382 RepID=UPI00235B5DE7
EGGRYFASTSDHRQLSFFPAGGIFCDRCRRFMRNIDPVILANLLPNLGKRNVSTKIGDGPLQPCGVSPATSLSPSNVPW